MNIEFKDIENALAALTARVQKIGQMENIPAKQKELSEQEALAAAPDFWNDNQKAKTVTQKIDSLKSSIETFHSLSKQLEDAQTLYDLAREMQDENELPALDAALKELEKQVEKKEFEITLSDPHDKLRAILNVHAGAGGTESCDWAQMLLRMYTRWAEQHGMKVSITDTLPGEEAGIKNASAAAYRDYLAGRGIYCFIFTEGAKQSTVFLNDEISIKKTPVIKVVDTVGAGDSFTASLVSLLMQGKTLDFAHEKAVEISAYVCTQQGAMPELSTKLKESLKL